MKSLYLVIAVMLLVILNLIALVSAFKGGPHFERSIAVIVISIVIIAITGLFAFQKAFRR